MPEDDKVKWPSRKKYPCKRNKGEHEWLEPIITYKPVVRYSYGNNGLLDSPELLSELLLNHAYMSLVAETRCKHCNKKVLIFFREKIK